MILTQYLVDFFLAVSFIDFKGLNNISQNGFQFLALGWDCFQASVFADVIFYYFVVISIGIHICNRGGEILLREQIAGFDFQRLFIQLIDIVVALRLRADQSDLCQLREVM